MEKGERAVLRLPLIERVAEVLDIPPAALTDEAHDSRATRCVDAREVETIRAALGWYPQLAAPELHVATREEVVRQLRYIEEAWLSSHFTVVARHLPRFLRDAQVQAMSATAEDKVAAARTLVVAYRIAASMLLKFEANDIAWLAADRAMQTALQVADKLSLARAVRSVARSLSSVGQLDSATTALIGMGDQLRPALPARSGELLAPYGMLYLAAAISAARREDAAMALDMHKEALSAARRLGEAGSGNSVSFGAANVNIHRVAALVRLHDCGGALRYARAIDPKLVGALPPERRANYMIDLTAALAETNQYDAATRTLLAAEGVAPEEVRCRPVTKMLLKTLVRKTNGEMGRSALQLASRAGLAT